MKRILLLVSTFLLAFVFMFTQGGVAEAAIDNKPGDIIITRSTSSKGVTGHIGIYIDSTTILHTSGRSSEPYPTTISESDWHARYAESKVIRPDSSSLGADAAQKAKQYFQGSEIPYKVTPGVKNISNTYCSELVWYAYYQAGKEFKVLSSSGEAVWATPNIIQPFDYTKTHQVNYNGFSFIDNTW